MEIKGYIYADWDKYDRSWRYTIYPYTLSDRVLVAEVQIPFESMDDRALRTKLAVILREKKSEVLADAQKEAMEIEGEIQSLLALEDHSHVD